MPWRPEMNIESEVAQLVRSFPRPLEMIPPPRPATEEDIRSFSERYGIPIAPDLRRWLLTHNGADVGGGIAGLHPGPGAWDMEEYFDSYPYWIPKGWLMIGSDQCGSVYVIDTKHTAGATHPVYFVDWEASGDELLDTPTCVVASGVWPFARFFLLGEAELDRGNSCFWWPWNRERVLAEDPDLAEYDGDVAFPWDLPA